MVSPPLVEILCSYRNTAQLRAKSDETLGAIRSRKCVRTISAVLLLLRDPEPAMPVDGARDFQGAGLNHRAGVSRAAQNRSSGCAGKLG